MLVDNNRGENKKLIVVLGMHRSGTSAITRGLQVLGVDLGDKLIPPIKDNNEKGFFEDIDLNSFNNEILHVLGSDWHFLSPIEESDIELLRKKGYFLRAVELIRQKVGNAAIFGLKDPRMAKLLPFWKLVFEHCQYNVRYILALRHPLSVVKSLAKRDGFTSGKSYLLWLVHVLTSLEYTNTFSRLVVDYDRLMHSPEHELRRIAENFTLQINSNEIQRYKSEFLDERLRHTSYDLKDLLLDDACPHLVSEIYTVLLDVARDRERIDDPELQKKIKIWSTEFKRLKPNLRLSDISFEQIANLSQAVGEKDEQIANLSQAVGEKDEQIANLSQAVGEKDEQIANLSQAVGEKDEQIANLSQAVGEKDKQIASLSQAVAERDGQITAILASQSWKVTRPLRFISRIFIKRTYRIFRYLLTKSMHRIWHSLPLSYLQKQKIKNGLFNNFPFFFGRTQSYKSWQKLKFTQGQGSHINVNEAYNELGSNSTQCEYVPLSDVPTSLKTKSVRLICFYLPQFHAIPENDAWWGKGFTEWANVVPAKPQFKGHYQPHEPGELGYYSLLDPTIMPRQVELAKLYGIEGFCFYFYWFVGKRLLETPLLNYLHDKRLDFPFCLCWANENWTRRWDGLNSEILIDQKYSEEDDLAFIQYLEKYLCDPRYIRIDGKPLLLVYRPSLLPSAKDTAKRWRKWCRDNGIGEIYLAYTQSFERVHPEEFGFDAAVEFPPNNSAPPTVTEYVEPLNSDFGCTVYDWQVLVKRSENYEQPKYKLFRGICPSWDNTPRRKNRSTVFINSSPVLYQQWLFNAIQDTSRNQTNPDERLIFINAWNEWAEGAHLEPDKQYGYGYLEATRMALIRHLLQNNVPLLKENKLAVIIHAFYPDILQDIVNRLNTIHSIKMELYISTPIGQGSSVQEILKDCIHSYHIEEMNNHGRDMLPFLKILPQVIENDFEILLKVHTKKSKHRTDGDIWRDDLFNKLITESSVMIALKAFKEDQTLGIIGPEGHLVSMNYYFGSNAQTVNKLASRLGINQNSLQNMSFVAGSMFFARTHALKPLLSLALNDEDFELEEGQIDGTMAHALERAITLSAESIGMSVKGSNKSLVNTGYQFAE